MNSCDTSLMPCSVPLWPGTHSELAFVAHIPLTERHYRKIDPKLAEKTWVYMIFGGLLRSRVKCLSCGHNSDTFDRMLDLSVDIAGVGSLRDALRKFVAVDHLRGADKYKCEKYVLMFQLGGAAS